MSVAVAQTTLVDQEGVNQEVPVIKSPGTFLTNNENKKVLRNGPLFTPQNPVAQVGKSDIKLQSETGYKMLDGFDIRRLGSILAQEAIKIGNLDPERITENDRKKVLRALHALNHKKYPFDLPDDEIVEVEEEEVALPTTTIEKEKVSSPSFFKERQVDAMESQYNKSTVLRWKKGKKPSEVRLHARMDIREKLAKLEEQKPKEPEQDLFAKYHKPVEVKVEVTPSIIEAPTAAPEENKINVVTNSPADKVERMKAVASLFEVLTKYRGENWMNWAIAISLGITNESNPHDDQMIPQNMHMKQISSWRDSPRIKEISDFLISLTTLTEEKLIEKYVSSYVNPNNPASWKSVSEYSANEIFHGEESVYGIMSDTRLEVSTLLKDLGTVDEETDRLQASRKYTGTDISTYQEYISLNPKLTVHDYYEEMRRRIAEADKKENK